MQNENTPTAQIGKPSKRNLTEFFSRIEVDPASGCWLWTGKTWKGYGHIQIAGKSVRVHRLSWLIHRGEIPASTPLVLHNCPNGDNSLCVNPDHLWLGTHTQNRADCCAKGRQAFGAKHGSHLHPETRLLGEKNHTSILTAAQVLEMRSLYAPGVFEYTRLAKRFGCSPMNAYKIIKRLSWTHI